MWAGLQCRVADGTGVKVGVLVLEQRFGRCPYVVEDSLACLRPFFGFTGNSGRMKRDSVFKGNNVARGIFNILLRRLEKRLDMRDSPLECREPNLFVFRSLSFDQLLVSGIFVRKFGER